jgi:plastocyanin
MWTRVWVCLMGLACVAGLGGCVGPSAEAKQAEAKSSAVVAMGFHSFDPPKVTIHAGETVLWENTSIIWHTVTADAAKAKDPANVALPAGAEAFDSGKVDSGGMYQHAFTVPGMYKYFCQPHEAMGMIGEVEVLPAKAP